MALPTGNTTVDRSPDEPSTHGAAPLGEGRIVNGPLRLDAIRAGLHHRPGAVGAIVSFTGVVRADPTAAGRVDRLEFECYPEMATPELERIRREACARWGLAGLTIHHRTGTLVVGEDIVAVVAAAAHRKEAFAAAAWTMDEIKRRVPLWKREVAADGTARWVPGDECRCMDAA